MKSKSLAFTFSAILLALSQIAATQVPPAPPRVRDVMPSTNGLDMVERERFMRHQLQGNRTIDRETLADQVAVLVEQGKCEDARRLARSEGDRAMARTVSRICHEGQPTRPVED